MFDAPGTISEALRASASACAGKAAIVDAQGTLTYGELDHQVDALATFLHKEGLRLGESVAYLLWNQRELLLSYHAITRMGAVVVSLNYRLSAAELAHQIGASKARAIVYDESFVKVVDEALALTHQEVLRIQVGGAPAVQTHSFARALSQPVDRAFLESVEVTADHVSGIWFTSGTEGTPKGAVVRHRSALAAAHASIVAVGIDRDTRCLAVAPLFHRGASENTSLGVTLAGGTHYLQSRFSPNDTLDALLRYEITLAFIVPTMARMLIAELKGQNRALPHLKSWISASAPLSPALEADVRRIFQLQSGVINVYGITEMLLIAAHRTSEHSAYDGCAGRPVPTMQIRIHDDARGLLPPGETGEILARGPMAFSHYLDNPAATEAARIHVDGVDWYRTGDIGRIDASGSLTILDRRKDMILSGGENIYSAEVEAAAALDPSVAEVAVVGRKDEVWGERVVALVVARGSEQPTLASVKAACRGLASYKHPKEVLVVPALPKNSFGKVKKNELKRQLEQSA